ncbi:PF04357 family protein, partial [Bordetella hinzii L60]
MVAGPGHAGRPGRLLCVLAGGLAQRQPAAGQFRRAVAGRRGGEHRRFGAAGAAARPAGRHRGRHAHRGRQPLAGCRLERIGPSPRPCARPD